MTGLGKLAMKFLRICHVMQLTGRSRMTIYQLELAGEFPKRRRQTPGCHAPVRSTSNERVRFA